MKYICLTIVSGVLVFLIVITMLLVFNKSQRETELNNAVESSLKETIREGFYHVFSSKEEGDMFFKNTFENKLESKIINGNDEVRDDNLKLYIEYKAVDSEEGLLSVRVNEQYTHVNGFVGNISKDAAVVADEEGKKEKYEVVFLVGNEVYRRYLLYEGRQIIRPKEPLINGKRFVEWKDEDNNTLKYGKRVDSSKVYSAVFV